MAQFQYSNNPQTTLSGSVTAGATSISVASGSAFPSRGRFTIIIDSEIMLVTGVSGTTWTVERGYDDTSAAAHNNNAAVTGILTRKSFLNAHHIDVRAYGAAGDGVTDDTAAIAAAIADIPSEGGILYFPPGTYLTTGGFTLANPTTVLGAGTIDYDEAVPASTILCNSTTASLFTVTSKIGRFERISLRNTAASAPTAGAAVSVTAAFVNSNVNFYSVVVHGFYYGLDIQTGASWNIDGCQIVGPVKYGIYVRNTINPDAGDWQISNCNINAQNHSADAGIYVGSSSGGKIVNCKINVGTSGHKFQDALFIDTPASTNMSLWLIANNGFEAYTRNGIRIAAAVGAFNRNITITGNLIGQLGTSTSQAIVLVGTETNAIENVTIVGNIGNADSSASASAMIELANVRYAHIGSNTKTGFGSMLALTACSSITTDDSVVMGHFYSESYDLWLSKAVYPITLRCDEVAMPLSASANLRADTGAAAGYSDLIIDSLEVSWQVIGAHDASNYWTLQLKDGAGVSIGSALSSATNYAGGSVWERERWTITAQLSNYDPNVLTLTATKVGSPGNLFLLASLSTRLAQA